MQAIVDKIKAYGFMALAVCLGLIAVGQSARLHMSQLKVASLQVQLADKDRVHAEERSAASAERTALEASHRATETLLQSAAADDRKKANDQIYSASVQRDSLLERVRAAEAAAAAGGGVSGAATAAGLGYAAPGGDRGQFLGTLGQEDVEEASRAETIRIHLLSCYAQYQRAQKALAPASKP